MKRLHAYACLLSCRLVQQSLQLKPLTCVRMVVQEALPGCRDLIVLFVDSTLTAFRVEEISLCGSAFEITVEVRQCLVGDSLVRLSAAATQHIAYCLVVQVRPIVLAVFLPERVLRAESLLLLDEELFINFHC